YDHIQQFGSLVYVTLPKEKRKKILSQHRAWKGILLGYTKTDSQYLVWDLDKKVIKVVRDAKIIPGIMPARLHYQQYFPYSRKPHNIDSLLEADEISEEDLE